MTYFLGLIIKDSTLLPENGVAEDLFLEWVPLGSGSDRVAELLLCVGQQA